jgi:Zn-dependent metalloprotease
MRSQLKQLSFHRVDEGNPEFRKGIYAFVKEHDKSDPVLLAKETLVTAWSLAEPIYLRLQAERERAKLDKKSVAPTSNRGFVEDKQTKPKNFSKKDELVEQLKEETGADEELEPVKQEEFADFADIDQIPFKFSSSEVTMFRFSQKYKGVPVYNSLSVVELDENKDIVSIQSSLAKDINGLSPDPKLKQKDIGELIKEKEGIDFGSNVALNPSLYYYFDSKKRNWRLVYITKIKVNSDSSKASKRDVGFTGLVKYNYVIDAHSQEIVDKLPCLRTLMPISEKSH